MVALSDPAQLDVMLQVSWRLGILKMFLAHKVPRFNPKYFLVGPTEEKVLLVEIAAISVHVMYSPVQSIAFYCAHMLGVTTFTTL
jgi:hypothetical protein